MILGLFQRSSLEETGEKGLGKEWLILWDFVSSPTDCSEGVLVVDFDVAGSDEAF